MLVENKEYLFDFELAFIFQSLCFSALPISKVSQSTFLLNKPELTRPHLGGTTRQLTIIITLKKLNFKSIS